MNNQLTKEGSMRRLRGFTLIELLVVIAIIGILATLVITQLGNARGKAVASGAKSDVTEAGKAIEVYKLDDGSNGQIILNVGTAADTLKGDSGTLTGIFAGAISTSSPYSYGLKFSKSSGPNITYTYKTSSNSASRSLGSAGYVFSAAGTELGDDAYYAQDGTTGSIAADSVPSPVAPN